MPRPNSANTTITPNATPAACQASRLLSRAERPRVSPRNTGTVPTGSMITNSVTNTSRKNFTARSSRTARRRRGVTTILAHRAAPARDDRACRAAGPGGRRRAGSGLRPAPGQLAQYRQRGEVGAGQRDVSHAEVHRDPALPGPVDVLQVQQQRELVDDKREPGAVAERHQRVPAVPVLAADGHAADAGQHADPPHVVVQMLAAHAEVAERAPAGPDAVGDAAHRAERGGERQPAQQGGALARVEFGAEGAAGSPCQGAHRRTIPVPVARETSLANASPPV